MTLKQLYKRLVKEFPGCVINISHNFISLLNRPEHYDFLITDYKDNLVLFSGTLIPSIDDLYSEIIRQKEAANGRSTESPVP